MRRKCLSAPRLSLSIILSFMAKRLQFALIYIFIIHLFIQLVIIELFSRSGRGSEDVELNTRREIPYLQATMYYFVYHINTIALYWEENPTSLMNENKLIDNPRITNKRALALTLKMENALNHDYKNFHIYARAHALFPIYHFL